MWGKVENLSACVSEVERVRSEKRKKEVGRENERGAWGECVLALG